MFKVIAIKFDREIGEARPAQNLDRSQNDVDAFGINILPKKAKTVLGSIQGRAAVRRGLVQLTVWNLEKLAGIDPPGGKMVDLKVRGAGVAVDYAEMPHEPHLSHQEMFRRVFRPALMAADRARCCAYRAVGGADHVAASHRTW